MAYAIVLPRRRGGFYLGSEARDTLEEAAHIPSAARTGARIILVTQETIKPHFTDEEVKCYDCTTAALARLASEARMKPAATN